MTIKEIISSIIILTALFIAFFFLTEWGMERQEQYECEQWKSQAIEFADKGFYLAKWQAEQCLRYKVEINAMIK